MLFTLQPVFQSSLQSLDRNNNAWRSDEKDRVSFGAGNHTTWH
ncbi:hypothetical protein YPPY15_2067, partial [Yersinia pestis PY-15]